MTPEDAGWRYLAFDTVVLAAGEHHSGCAQGRETAITVLAGSGTVTAGDLEAEVTRDSVFTELGRVVYVAPGEEYSVVAGAAGVEFAVGSAPAEGRYPTRVIEPSEMRSEIRGGGQAHRQVIHTVAPPIDAERLILYQVYVPRGTWSGWPPHCHDGHDGSPYLEETYWFRLDRPEGYAIHRNWRDGAFDETFVVHDRGLVTVPAGYHTSVACPGANMYFLNYLAGDLIGEERSTPPCFAAEYTWIEADWTAGEWSLPIVPTT